MAKLITKAQQQKLLKNGEVSEAAAMNGGKSPDPRPVVKLFTPDAQATWLLTEIDPAEHTRAFGLCDLGMQSPELGWVDLEEIARLRGPMRLPVERDRWFKATKTLTEYANEARRAQRIQA